MAVALLSRFLLKRTTIKKEIFFRFFLYFFSIKTLYNAIIVYLKI
jgi:hypothetical protein